MHLYSILLFQIWIRIRRLGKAEKDLDLQNILQEKEYILITKYEPDYYPW